MTEHRDDYMDEIERIAGEAAKQRTEPKPISILNATVKIGEDLPPVEVAFLRDLGDTWSVHVGPGMYMAIRSPEQGVVISRLVEMIAGQYRAITFDTDGTERNHE